MGIVDRDDAGAIRFDSAMTPRLRTLNVLLSDLPSTAAEDMLGDLRGNDISRNYRETAGPAESQLYDEDVDGNE